ncbi:MAG: CoA transferase [Alphaproteobacteria bacterium]|nr:CoA transferase [Alphaproteobacteria bacterium]
MDLDYRPDAPCALEGVRVLDISRLVAGNAISHVLADHGAEVVKVEDPEQGDALRHWTAAGVSCNWKVYARNKKSISLNLRSEKGRALLLDLLPTAQVLVENFKAGALERMGLGPDVLLARNPKLVVARVSGYGQTGPYAHRPGFGTLVEAMSGFAYKNGFPDRPPALPPLALADMVAGLYGAFGVMVALREVELKGGEGQVIDLSLLEPVVSILGPDAAIHSATGEAPARLGNASNTTSPRNAYRTKDGEWIAMSGSMQSMAMRIFRTIGRADMCDDPRYNTQAARSANREEVDAIVGGFIAGLTLAEAMEVFEREGVTAGPIYSAAQLKEDRHAKERGVIVNLPDDELGSLPMHNVIPRLSRTPGAIRTPAPEIGAHNEEILGGLGLDLDRLKEEGAL